MVRIYFDESGDLGFGSKASKHLIIVGFIVKNTTQIKKCLTKVRKQKLPKKYKKIPELKWHNSSSAIKKRIIECISTTDAEIAYAVLRKHQVRKNLRDKPHIIYNYVLGSLFSKIIRTYQLTGTVDMFVDKSLYGVQKKISTII